MDLKDNSGEILDINKEHLIGNCGKKLGQACTTRGLWVACSPGWL